MNQSCCLKTLSWMLLRNFVMYPGVFDRFSNIVTYAYQLLTSMNEMRYLLQSLRMSGMSIVPIISEYNASPCSSLFIFCLCDLHLILYSRHGRKVISWWVLLSAPVLAFKDSCFWLFLSAHLEMWFLIWGATCVLTFSCRLFLRLWSVACLIVAVLFFNDGIVSLLFSVRSNDSCAFDSGACCTFSASIAFVSDKFWGTSAPKHTVLSCVCTLTRLFQLSSN